MRKTFILLPAENDDEQKKVYLKDIDGKEKELSFLNFKEFILRETRCRYINSSAKGGEESTPFSRFFRENLGAGFCMTDIDFLLPNSIFIEEKTWVESSGNKVYGYIGHGQCLSFNELVEDVFKEHCRIFIIFSAGEYFYMYPYKKMECKKKSIDNWGDMAELDLTKCCKYSKENLVRFIKENVFART